MRMSIVEQQAILTDMLKSITNTDIIIVNHFIDLVVKKTKIPWKEISQNIDEGHFEHLVQLCTHRNGCRIFLTFKKDNSEHSFEQAMMNMRNELAK